MSSLSFVDESPIKSKPKQTTRTINNPNTTRPPEQPKLKSISHKPLSKNTTTKTNKVTFSDDKPTPGVFMTMDDISELVKAVKGTKKNINFIEKTFLFAFSSE
jgi:hypothetical protein